VNAEQNTTRNLWPLGVIGACGLFVAGTVGLIVMACFQKNDLVRPDYYEQELRHQRQIDRVQRTRLAAAEVNITYDPARNRLTIALPPAQAIGPITGTIELYRPSASALDLSYPLKVDTNGLQSLDTAALAPGLWRVRVAWTAGKEDYYVEKKVIIGSQPF
jgi:nitrogen fixation protein FixH